MLKTILSADIGGTNTNIALCSFKGSKVILHKKYQFESQKLKGIEDAVKQVLKDAKVKISAACVAAAGVVSSDRKTCKPTKLNWKVDVRKLPFNCVLLNDFEALGYAVNVLQSKDVKVLRAGKSCSLPIALIGAGTGLGKSLLHYNGKIYVPSPSEGGHADLPVTAEESELLIWSRKSFEYDDILSGRGIVTLYNFMRSKYEGSGTSDPAEIMKEESPAAEAARKQFIKFYARCAKNFVLDGLARGGVVIGGGIAAKNPQLFGREFLLEFVKNVEYRALLEKIPIKVITNYDASLIGAAFASKFYK